MTTWTALTTLPSKAQAEALGEALEAMDPVPEGVAVFEIEDGLGRFEVGAHFTEAPDAIALSLLAAVWGAAEFAVSELPETDWVAHVRRELAPVEAGRFFVHGAHDSDKVPPGREALLIEAAMAFGTGHHATTRGCLLELDRLEAQGFVSARIADIGCGTAVLAMAAARLWPGAQVVATDIDPQAVEVAAVNLRANGLADRIGLAEAAGFDHPALSDGTEFDLIAANILLGPLVDLAPDFARRLAPGGRAVLSGILSAQAETLLAAFQRLGMVLQSRMDEGEWAALTLKKI